MFPIAATILLAGGPIPEVIATTRNLELSLKVIEAFENGPVILDVSLTNRGEKPIAATILGRESGVGVPSSPKWLPIRSRRPWCGGGGAILDRTLVPGATRTERHYFSLAAGTHEFTFYWPLHLRRNRDDSDWPLIASPAKRFLVTVTPATPANRKALATRLEAEFAALNPNAVGDSDELEIWSEKLTGTHKELVPLMLRVVDRCDAASRHSTFKNQVSRRLISSIFWADPAAAHRTFVDRMLASPAGTDPRIVFEVWTRPTEEFADIGESYMAALLNPIFWFTPELWGELSPLGDFLEIVRWADDYAPNILPDAELRRLATAKDFWVRGWVYATFGYRLGAEWCEGYRKEVKARLTPKLAADTAKQLVAELGHADFKVRERAEAALRGHGYDAVAALRVAVKDDESAEVRERAARLLVAIKPDAEPTPEVRSLLFQLWFYRDRADNRKLLETFAAGGNGDPACQYARKLLEKKESP